MTMSVSEVTYRLNGFCEALLLLRTLQVRVKIQSTNNRDCGSRIA